MLAPFKSPCKHPFLGGLGAARRALLGVGLGRFWAGRVNGQVKGCRPDGQHPLGSGFKRLVEVAHPVSLWVVEELEQLVVRLHVRRA